MNRRLIPFIVVLCVGALPSAASAQTSDYNDMPTLSTNTTTTPTATAEPTTSTSAPTTSVEAETAGGGGTAPTAVAPATSTGTTPSTLAYTGSDAWLIGLIGLFALVGGAALLRPARRA